MGHDRTHLKVSHKKDPLHYILFDFLYLTVFCPFLYKRLYLIFRHLAFLGIYVKQPHDARGALCKNPYERRGYYGEEVHGFGDHLCSLLSHTHAYSLWHQFAKDKGKIGYEYHYYGLPERMGDIFRNAPVYQYRGKVVCQHVSGIDTGKDAYDRYSYLNGRKESVRLLCQFQSRFCRLAAPFYIIGKTRFSCGDQCYLRHGQNSVQQYKN